MEDRNSNEPSTGRGMDSAASSGSLAGNPSSDDERSEKIRIDGQAGASALREWQLRSKRDRSAVVDRLPISIPVVVASAVGAYLGVQILAGVINHSLNKSGHTGFTVNHGLAHLLGLVAAVTIGTKLGKEAWGSRQTTDAWRVGADGEQAVGRRLDRAAGPRFYVLHDRRPPGDKWNIDHVVVSTSGVYVIDTKVAQGRVEVKRTGNFLRPGPSQLMVRGRIRTDFTEGMDRQVRAVWSLLRTCPAAAGASVKPLVVIVNASWGPFARPFNVGGVWIGWPRRAVSEIRRHGSIPEANVEVIFQFLREHLQAY